MEPETVTTEATETVRVEGFTLTVRDPTPPYLQILLGIGLTCLGQLLLERGVDGVIHGPKRLVLAHADT